MPTMNDIYNKTFDLLGEGKKKKKGKGIRLVTGPETTGGRVVTHGLGDDAEAEDERNWDPKLKRHVTPTLTKPKKLKRGDKGYDRKADLEAPMTPEDEAKDKEADTPMRGMQKLARQKARNALAHRTSELIRTRSAGRGKAGTGRRRRRSAWEKLTQPTFHPSRPGLHGLAQVVSDAGKFVSNAFRKARSGDGHVGLRRREDSERTLIMNNTYKRMAVLIENNELFEVSLFGALGAGAMRKAGQGTLGRIAKRGKRVRRQYQVAKARMAGGTAAQKRDQGDNASTTGTWKGAFRGGQDTMSHGDRLATQRSRRRVLRVGGNTQSQAVQATRDRESRLATTRGRTLTPTGVGDLMRRTLRKDTNLKRRSSVRNTGRDDPSHPAGSPEARSGAIRRNRRSRQIGRRRGADTPAEAPAAPKPETTPTPTPTPTPTRKPLTPAMQKMKDRLMAKHTDPTRSKPKVLGADAPTATGQNRKLPSGQRHADTAGAGQVGPKAGGEPKKVSPGRPITQHSSLGVGMKDIQTGDRPTSSQRAALRSVKAGQPSGGLARLKARKTELMDKHTTPGAGGESHVGDAKPVDLNSRTARLNARQLNTHTTYARIGDLLGEKRVASTTDFQGPLSVQNKMRKTFGPAGSLGSLSQRQQDMATGVAAPQGGHANPPRRNPR